MTGNLTKQVMLDNQCSQTAVTSVSTLDGATPFEIVPYGNKASGFENHHGVLDVWATKNIEGYESRASDSPSIRLSTPNHAATKGVYRDWLNEKTGKPVGGKVDWTTVTANEAQSLTEAMFDAAGVPQDARQAYYSAFNQYIYRQ